jgi:hypothetical protein
MENDRRRHKRYSLNHRVFAIVRSDAHALDRIDHMSKGTLGMAIIKSNPMRMGEILDISRSGLSFRYIATNRTLTSPCEMDILCSDGDYHLTRLPIQTVEDTFIAPESPFEVLKMKRLTVKFGGLTNRQKSKLNQLLEDISTGKRGITGANKRGVAGQNSTNM